MYVQYLYDAMQEYSDQNVELALKPKSFTYCIEVQRSGEEDCVLHHTFDKEPTREDILAFIEDEDLGYDEDYGKFEYYPV